ncbi:MAG: DUF2625 family protein [Planctomycetota bacterium]|nr:DUF2625 family protein [Planctomycetota bacterium]
MRPLAELLAADDPAWPLVAEWLRSSRHPVDVLPAERARDHARLGAVWSAREYGLEAGRRPGVRRRRRSSGWRL